MVLGLIILGLIVLAGFLAIGTYNQLVTLRNRFKNSFAQIDVQLKRRHDLIPNLVETAKAFLTHEKSTLENVTQARNVAIQANHRLAGDPANTQAMAQVLTAESALSQSLGRLLATVEAYPDLKSNQNMIQVSEELTATENKIAFARQAFNDSVTTYNTARETFPQNIIANFFNFKEAQFWEMENSSHRDVPKVNFGT